MTGLQNIFCILSFLVLSACGATKPFYSDEEHDWKEKKMPDSIPEFTLFLVGGLDYESSSTHETFELLRKQVNPEDTSHAIVYLNDHIYKKKKQSENEIEKVVREKQLDKQFDFLKKDKGKLFFVYGHDRNHGKGNFNRGTVKEYVEEKTGKKKLFYPEQGCTGPDEIKLPGNVVLIPVNTSY